MKTTLIILAAAVLVLQLRPTAACAQTYPDPTTGCGVRPLGMTAAPVSDSAPGAAFLLTSLLGPVRTLGIESSTWLAGLTVVRSGRGLRDNRTPERSLAANRRRVGAAGR